MVVPPGHTEQSVLDAIERVVGILGPSFIIPGYGVDDLKQEGRLFCLELLAKEKYKPELPLENFLYMHVRNQFINLHRKLCRRTDTPCRSCHRGQPCGPDGQECRAYRKWNARQIVKTNINRPLDLGGVSPTDQEGLMTPPTAAADAEFAELNNLIDTRLSVELRADYLRLLDGQTVPPLRRERVQKAVADILATPGHEPATECPSPDLTGVDDWTEDEDEDLDDEPSLAAA